MAGVAIRGRGTGLSQDPAPVGGRLAARLAGHAASTPDAVAVSGGGQRWSYREFDAVSGAVAARLRALGIGVGDTVAVYARRTPALAVALVAVARSGAAFTVLDAAHPGERLRQYAVRTAPVAWLTCGAGEPPAALTGTAPVLRVSDAPGSGTDGPDAPGPDAAGAASGTTTGFPPVSASLSGGPYPADRRAYTSFTSGTTGTPRAVEGGWEAVEHFLDWYTGTFALGSGDRVAVLSGLGHDPLLRDVFVPLWAGGSAVFPDAGPGEAAAVARWLADEAVTVVHLSPGLGDALADAAGGGAHGAAWPALRLVGFGGDVLGWSTVDAWAAHAPGARLLNLYGTTETPQAVSVAVAHEPGAPPAVRSGPRVPLGPGIEGVELLVRYDDATLVPAVNADAPGELVVRTRHLARYADTARPDTASPDGPAAGFGGPDAGDYRTGDRVRPLPGGALVPDGRLDGRLTVRGFRLEPAETEAALLLAPGVARAAVAVHGGSLTGYVVPAAAAAPDPDAVSTPAAAPGPDAVSSPAITPAPGTVSARTITLDPDAVRDFVAGLLPAYAVPDRVVVLGALPLTDRGKTDRAALPAPVPDEATGGRAAGRAPRGVREELMCGLFAEVLGIRRARPGDDFFALGGHSLKANRLVNRVRRIFGVTLPANAVFDAPTPAALAARLDGAATGRPALTRAERPARLPLSAAQRRLWFLQQLDADDTSYNIALTLRLTGPLDRGALRAALGDLTDRHEVLRTVYRQDGGEPCQEIRDEARPELPVTAATRTALPDLLSAAARHRFDLAAEPPLHTSLFAVDDGSHVLLLVLHHIATDGGSLAPLGHDLSRAYAARAGGAAPDWEPLPVQYADYTLWQHGADDSEAQLGYWAQRLAGLPDVLELPTDRPRPAVASNRGARTTFTVDAALHQGLAALARRTGSTLFMTVQAGMAALFTRLGAGTDIPFGTATTGRSDEALDPLIGCFANTLCLRTDTSGAPSFRDLLGRVRAADLADFAHQDLPLDRLVEHLNPGRSLAYHPLFQTMLTFQGADRAEFDLPGLGAELGTVDRGAAKTDLSFLFQESADGALAGTLEYATDLFDAEGAQALAEMLVRLLASAVADPARSIAELDILGADDRARLLYAWNDTGRTVPDATLPELFEAQVRRTPDAVAVEHDGATLTYRQLNARANRIARLLVARGVGPERYAAVALERSTDLVAVLLAVGKAGGAYLPLDLSYPAERIAFMLEDVAPVTVITTAGVSGRLPDSVPQLILDAPETAEELSGADPETTGPGTGPETTFPATDLTDRERNAPLLAAHPAFVIFTSGSTGRPKGVVVEHRSLNLYLAWTRQAYDQVAGRALVHSPVSFDLTVTGLFAPLTSGGSIQLVGLDGSAPDNAVTRRPTFVKATPSHLPLLTELPDTFSPSGQLVLGGESLMGEVLQEWRDRHPGATVINEYGPTETTVGCTEYRIAPGETVPAGVITIGTPVWNTRMYVLDARLRPVPPGVPGELYIAGGLVTRGYAGRPGLTAGRFVADPFGPPGARMYRSGDLARWNRAGRLEFISRVDHQVKVRGFRIEPGEIESVLGAHPGVFQTAVIVREDRPGDRRIVAYAVPAAKDSAALTDSTTGAAATAGTGDATADAGAVTAEGLRAYAAGRLPDYMVPAAVVLIDRLPLTANRKLDRAALPLPELPAAAGGPAPRTAAEEILCGLFAEVLGIEAAGPEDNFFDLGGHSLLATRLIGRIRPVFGADLSIRVLFEAPTVRELAARLPTADGAGARPSPRPRPDRIPLSHAQRGLWFLNRLHTGATTYNVPLAVRLRGPLDLPALEAALGDLTARHETLRTVYPESEGEPYQRVLPVAGHTPALDVLDVTDEELPGALADAARHVFVLDTAPPVRFTLLRTGPRSHVLVVLIHHIAADGWSTGPLLRDLSHAYAARTGGRAPAAEPLPLAYADYALWQRERLGSADDPDSPLARQGAYWAERLAGSPELIPLPLDRPRPAVASHRGGRVPFRLDGKTHGALSALARSTGTTAFMVLHAAVAALLTRLGAGTDIPVGTAVAGRSDEALEGLVGFFVNTLVLRTDTSGNPTFHELLDRVRETDLAAYSHQDVPFDRVVEIVNPVRSLAHHPLFQVMLVGQDAAAGAADFPELSAQVEDLSAGAAKFDLTISVEERPASITGTLGYAADLFDAGTARTLTDRLVRLIEAAVADPALPIGELPLLPAAERERVLYGWNATGAPVPAGSLPARFEEQAARTPDAVALRSGADVLTYGGLNRRANRLAHRLIADGTGPESRVVLHLEPSFDAVVAVLAVLKAGAVYVPLDTRYPADRIRVILEQSRAQRVITDRTGPAAVGFPPDMTVLRVGEEDGAGHPGTTHHPCTTGHPGADTDPLLPIHPDRLAYTMFTSGSTGVPKGVAVTHRAVVALAADPAFAGTPHRRVLLHSPLAFDASTYELWVPLLSGGEVVIAPPGEVDVAVLREVLGGGRVTAAFFTTALFNLLTEGDDSPLAGLREVWTGGEACSPAAMRRAAERFPRTTVTHVYGPTESTTFATAHRVRTPYDYPGAPPIGGPLANTTAYVLDGRLRPVPAGVTGELYLGGAGLARGYLGRPDLTAGRFVADPYGPPGARIYRTGDLVRWNGEGQIEFMGRADHQVKVRGFRIELGEIEAVLAADPAVAQVAVVVREDRPGDRRITAYAVPAGGAGFDAAAVRAAAARTLPAFMVPSAFVPLEVLPLTPNGKLDHKALPAPDTVSRPAGRLPTTEREKLLCGLFADVLGLETVGIDDNFFELGGHSLLATRLISRTRTALGAELPIRTLFENPTVETLVGRLAVADRARPALRPMRRTEETS
ncbi:amino acid adenylation domain-containing protein [Streptomyces sp. NPDC059398]|uniref:amino acid adenylation domain-containing protein n=1 Tax=Streptomyces sp. NPDC059398 TaxID=3346820 RepID=UPI00367A9536